METIDKGLETGQDETLPAESKPIRKKFEARVEVPVLPEDDMRVDEETPDTTLEDVSRKTRVLIRRSAH